MEYSRSKLLPYMYIDGRILLCSAVIMTSHGILGPLRPVVIIHYLHLLLLLVIVLAHDATLKMATNSCVSITQFSLSITAMSYISLKCEIIHPSMIDIFKRKLTQSIMLLRCDLKHEMETSDVNLSSNEVCNLNTLTANSQKMHLVN